MTVSTLTVPEVGRSNPPSIFSKVDLPLPDVPMMATNSPGSMEMLTPSRALTMFGSVPYCFVSCLVLKMLIYHDLTFLFLDLLSLYPGKRKAQWEMRNLILTMKKLKPL